MTKVLLLVLDGLPARHVGLGWTPVLHGLAVDGGWAPAGRSVLPSSTYPNHATFVTGAAPKVHGLLANRVPTPSGDRPAWRLGPRVATLFDACTARGLASACVVGDPDLIGVMGAATAERSWPPGGRPPASSAGVSGHAVDGAVVDALVEAVDERPDLTVAQLSGPDAAGHLFGPDNADALAAYRHSDSQLGRLRAALAPVWDELVWILVSDHDQETVLPAEPIDLGRAVAVAGLDLRVVNQGNAALLSGPDLVRGHLLAGLEGVAGLARLPSGAGQPEVVLLWAQPGRWFAAPGEPPLAGVHGGPRNRAQVAVVSGGHPAVPTIAAAMAGGVEAADWAATVAELLGLRLPAASGPSLLSGGRRVARPA